MVEESYYVEEGIRKEILHGGRGPLLEWKKNTKVFFHFRTTQLCESSLEHACGSCRPVDDSRQWGGGVPLTMLTGREFKLPLWEKFLKTMRVGEVATISHPYQKCFNYGTCSAAWRRQSALQAGESAPPEPRHSCAASMHQGTGYKDLDEIAVAMRPFKLEMELVDAQAPEDHQLEHWAMSSAQMLEHLPVLRSEGRALFQEKSYPAALQKFKLAITYCHNVLENNRDAPRPGTPLWKEVVHGNQVPLYVNAALCFLRTRDFAAAADGCRKALEIDALCVKAHFVLGSALAGCWQLAEARLSYERAEQLDSSLAATVKAKLAELDRLTAEKNESDRENYRKMFK